MEARVSLITLATADVARTERFYAALGWTPEFRNDHMLVYDLIGQSLGFYDRAWLARDMGVAEEALGTGACTLAHNVRSREEVATLMDKAEGAGAKVLKPAGEIFWGGVVGYFADPDGHVWEIAWNPGSVLREDGAFRWNGYGASDG